MTFLAELRLKHESAHSKANTRQARAQPARCAVPALVRPRALLLEPRRPNADAPASSPGSGRSQSSSPLREVKWPSPHRTGRADATSKAGAGRGILAGPARLRPTAGRQAPVSRQQVNTARPRPATHRPAFVRAARPRAPCPCGVIAASRGAGGLGEAGAQARRGGSSVTGCPLTPPGSPELVGLLGSVARSPACGGSQTRAEEEAGCAAGMGAGAPPPGDTENWGRSLHFKTVNPCHTHLHN